MQIHLIRHGHFDPDPAAVWTAGYPDPPLSSLGQTQAEQLAAQVKDWPVSRIYSSDLLRTRQTAAPAAQRLGLEIQLEPALREIHMGDVFTQGWEQVRREQPDFAAAFDRREPGLAYPNGESAVQVLARALPVFQAISRQETGSALVFTHGGMIMIVLAHCLGLALEERFNFYIDHASITTLDWQPGEPCGQVLRLNDRQIG